MALAYNSVSEAVFVILLLYSYSCNQNKISKEISKIVTLQKRKSKSQGDSYFRATQLDTVKGSWDFQMMYNLKMTNIDKILYSFVMFIFLEHRGSSEIQLMNSLNGSQHQNNFTFKDVVLLELDISITA